MTAENRTGIFNLRILKSLIFTSQGGFTLIEMLLAFAILSIILVALYSTFFLSSRAMEGIDESLVKLQECRVAIDIMRRELESIVYDEKNKNSVLKVEDCDIYGRQASRFSFTAFSPNMPALAAIRYYVEEKDGKLAMFKKINAVYKSSQDEKGVEIMEDIEKFAVEIKYNGKWIKMWDTLETKSIPDEFRISITVLIKGRPVPVFETIKPKIGRPV